MDQTERDKCLNLLGLFTIEGKKASEVLTEGEIQIFHAIVFRPKNRVQILCSTQYGKKLSDDTPILTNLGWKTHGELKVGDFLFSPDGKQIKVLGIANDGIDCEYQIEFTNGEKVACHAKHEWVLSHRGWKNSKKPYRVIETESLLGYKNLKDFRLPLIKPLEFIEHQLPVDPYTFGAWLGDGTTGEPVFNNSVADRQIRQKIPYTVSSESVHKTTGVITYRYYKNGLDYFGKLGQKHIPYEYLTATIQQRLEILAGIIDTDGSVNKQTRENGWRMGRVYISNSNKRLVDDICELITGLGMRPSVTKVKACKSSSGIEGKKDVYYIGFQPFYDIPTAITRKKINKLEQKRRIGIKKIIKILPKRGKCIEVEGGVYLAGRKLIPTHNSLTVALACLIVSCIQGELIAVVAPKDEKAKIIMRYFIDHLGDHFLFYSQLEKDTKLERLRMEESKERIGLRNRGGIYVLSAQASNSQKGIEAAMGSGAKILISDESSLIGDQIESTIFRMIAGQGKDAFYCKIGNPFYRNHFYTSWNDPNYHKIFIDYKQGLSEGRYTEQFIEEAKKKPNFDILFACEFPPEDTIDERGYIRLFTTEEIQTATRKVEPFGEQRLGVDIAEGGGDYNAFVIRTANYAGLLMKYRNEDTMLVPGHIINIYKELEMRDENIFMDTIGIGKGPYDRLTEQRYNPTSVKFSEKADDETQFANLKAECFWRLKQWINTGGCLDPDDDWKQLLDIKYKVDSSGRIQIISKDDLRKEGKASPDIADSLAMTFARKSVILSKDKHEAKKIEKEFDFYKKQKKGVFTGSTYLRS